MIFKVPTDLNSYLQTKKKAGVTIGFVPTMGALHRGHISLINQAKLDTQLVVCSIFVNPTQFNDINDFKKYPLTIEQDIFLLDKAGCNVVFLPSVDDMYPLGIQNVITYHLGKVEHMLEGEFRKGHFQGVCQVVHRLLDIVVPDKLFLGQKDLQQCMVIKKLIEIIKLDTEVIICATLREANGLAMSSRNTRLNEIEKEKAANIYQALRLIQSSIEKLPIETLKTSAITKLTAIGFKVDYIEIAEAETLEPIVQFEKKIATVCIIAAYLNEVRLIDNILMN